MLCYFFRCFDYGYSASCFPRSYFGEEFLNTGTSFFELRVLITASFFKAIFSTFVLIDFLIFFFFFESNTFEQFSSVFSAKVKSELLACRTFFMKLSIVTIYITWLYSNYQNDFFKHRGKKAHWKFSQSLSSSHKFFRQCPKPSYRYSAIYY